MRYKVNLYCSNDNISDWDEWTKKQKKSVLYHLNGWESVISSAYGHKTYYLVALDSGDPDFVLEKKSVLPTKIVGILPLVHIKSFLFGNSLVSLPYFDMGGALADNEEVEQHLLEVALKFASEVNADELEIRQGYKSGFLNRYLNKDKSDNGNFLFSDFSKRLQYVSCNKEKVRMLLTLPKSSDLLMKSFKSKLRSQIKKPVKEGLVTKIGWNELLDDFYDVFLVNMRDLGSPVHSKKFIKSVFETYRNESRIFVVYKENKAVAASIVIGFNGVLENPWASSLREYGRFSPNMLLYWKMLEFACDNGYSSFDFGRSTPGEGTYKFKEQWGASPSQLYWYRVTSKIVDNEVNSYKSKYNIAITYWQKLPVFVTKYLGPILRKYITL